MNYGMRRSEILGLKWNAINFKKGIISIKHTVVRVKNITPEDLTKTPAGRRDLALFPTAITCLQSIKEEQDRNKKFFGNEYKNTEGSHKTSILVRARRHFSYIKHLFTFRQTAIKYLFS